MPKINFREPPKVEDKELYQYLWELHNLIIGIGSAVGVLDTTNINGQLTDTIDHSSFTNVTAYQHHGSGSHNLLDQGDNVTDATASTISITSTDADATYSTNEQDLINELKADVNSLIAEYNTFLGKVNSLLANLRTANVIG